jgi:hypothetical protein
MHLQIKYIDRNYSISEFTESGKTTQPGMGRGRAEGEAAGDGKPRALPMRILDQFSRYPSRTTVTPGLNCRNDGMTRTQFG